VARQDSSEEVDSVEHLSGKDADSARRKVVVEEAVAVAVLGNAMGLNELQVLVAAAVGVEACDETLAGGLELELDRMVADAGVVTTSEIPAEPF